MRYVIAIITALFCMLLAYATLNKDVADKLKILHIAGSKGEKSISLTALYNFINNNHVA